MFAFPFALAGGWIGLLVESRIPSTLGILGFVVLGGALGAALSTVPAMLVQNSYSLQVVIVGGAAAGLTEASIWWREIRVKELENA